VTANKLSRDVPRATRIAEGTHRAQDETHDFRWRYLVSALHASAGPVARRLIRRAATAITVALASAAGLFLMTPSADLSPALAAQLEHPAATPFGGTAAVGALFSDVHGKLKHFCTASVVRSPAENVLITAAHCIQGRKLTPLGAVTFAPGYHDGKFPHGQWVVRASFVDHMWRKDRDPNDDVAFLIAGRPGRHIQKFTGAERLETSAKVPQKVEVIGYPDASDSPVTCTALARPWYRTGLRQLVFDCDGYTNGTSGGPFLSGVSTSTGEGKVIGVIGGYQEGGDSPNVSYSSRFLAAAKALYKTATS
jgi:V8-like Glu-specific endopeptidase